MNVRQLLLACILLSSAASPGAAQLRWQTFVNAGEAWCLEARGSEVWAGTSGRLRCYKPDGDRVQVKEVPLGEVLAASAVTAITFDRDSLWVGTRAGQVARLDLASNAWTVFDTRAKLPAATVTAFCHDGQDLWVGTTAGVARFNPLRQEFDLFTRDDGLPSDNIICLAADAGGLWAGTDQGVLRCLRDTWVWRPVAVAGRLQGRIEALASTGENLWLVAAGEGLTRIKLTNGEVFSYRLDRYGVSRVVTLRVVPPGDLWIGTPEGLLQAPASDAGGPWRFIEQALPQLTALQVTSDAVWTATRDSGVWRYQPATGEWQQFKPAESLPGGLISGVAALPGAAWFAFRDSALAYYDLGADRWETYQPTAEQPRRLRDVAAWEDRVYVAAADGLALFNRRTKAWRTVRQAELADLLSDEWTSVVATGEGVWCAGPGRVAVFDSNLEHQATFQFQGLEGNRDGSLPRLQVDPNNGDIWAWGRGGAFRYLPRARVWQEFEPGLFQPTNSGSWQREGRLLRDVGLDNDSAWLVGLDRVMQYRKQRNELCLWNADHLPGLLDPRFVAGDRESVWVAAGNALWQYLRASGNWRSWPWSDCGWQDVRPTALAGDDEEPYVWAATTAGVARLELDREPPRWRVFQPSAGIVANVRRIVTTRFAVWFVGDGGVTVYRREQSAQ
ncbi:MAG: hypothetical protein IT204_07965 [Fimbriimonadaceae bacterium]|nr:hypothetical protein [Fimbriimonadaceae bacterium]